MINNNKEEEVKQYYETEHFDSEEEINLKVKELAQLINTSKYVVLYTGAGISTSAGIPDFRGPKGVWTLQEKGISRKTLKSNPYIKIPTPTHMAISLLYKFNKIHYITSQNVDGLHIKSGLLRKDMSELHGNTNVEICKHCNKEYIRDFRCRNAKDVNDHKTNRKCDTCHNDLFDTIINFGEELPKDQFERALENAQKADLAIVIGTSLRVSPACDLPELCKYKKKGKLVIINLQHTPKDIYSDIRIYAKTDKVIEKLMKELNLEIPPFILQKGYRFGVKKMNVLLPTTTITTTTTCEDNKKSKEENITTTIKEEEYLKSEKKEERKERKVIYFEPIKSGNKLSSNLLHLTQKIIFENVEELPIIVKDKMYIDLNEILKDYKKISCIQFLLEFNLEPKEEKSTIYEINYFPKQVTSTTIDKLESSLDCNNDIKFDLEEEEKVVVVKVNTTTYEFDMDYVKIVNDIVVKI
ncbi:hypothetical protein ABK040_007428 [Willaertia magna]